MGHLLVNVATVFLSAPFIIWNSIQIAMLLEVFVFLHQLVCMQVPQEDFAVIRGREKPAHHLRVLNRAHIIFVVLES